MTRRVLRPMLAPVLAGAICAVIGWLFGVVPADAVMIGLLVATGVAVPRVVPHPPAAVWPLPPAPRGGGTWYDVRRLSTALSQSGTTRDVFQSKARSRLRELAEARLARQGVRWSDPAARRLLTPEVYDLLNGSGVDVLARSPVALLELVLDRLDELPDGRAALKGGSS